MQYSSQFFIDCQNDENCHLYNAKQFLLYKQRITKCLSDFQITRLSNLSSVEYIKQNLALNQCFYVTLSSPQEQGIPTFQLSQSDTIKPIIGQILQKLAGKYKDWELMMWFTSNNDELAAAPIDVIDDPQLHPLLIELADNENP